MFADVSSRQKISRTVGYTSSTTDIASEVELIVIPRLVNSTPQPEVMLVTIAESVELVQALWAQSPVTHELTGEMMELLEEERARLTSGDASMHGALAITVVRAP